MHNIKEGLILVRMEPVCETNWQPCGRIFTLRSAGVDFIGMTTHDQYVALPGIFPRRLYPNLNE
jgi:hypothetical protein